MKLLSVIVLLISSALLSPANENKEAPMFTDSGHTTDELSVVKARLESQEAVLLDVREDDEWAEGHLKHASLVPLSEVRKGDIPEKYKKLFPKDKPIYLHCQAGGRVLKCSQALKDHGYDIRPLKTGYPSLVEFGFEKASEKPSP